MVAIGPLFARLRVVKDLRGCAVQQWYTLWAGSGRVDCRTEIRWDGARNWHVRQGLPTATHPRDVVYGSPFFASRWTDIMPGAGPRNTDEIAPEIYGDYRELQGWLHLERPTAGLTVTTLHPSFHFGGYGLEALLLRTPLSCGDPRYYWEEAGLQRYEFSFVCGAPDWRVAGAIRLGAMKLRPPVGRFVGSGLATGTGPSHVAESLLHVEGDQVEISALYPGETSGTVVVRLWETTGTMAAVSLRGALALAHSATRVDLLERAIGTVAGEPGSWDLVLSPWEIASVSLADWH